MARKLGQSATSSSDDSVDRRGLGRDRDAGVDPPGPVVVPAAGQQLQDADLDDAVDLGVDARRLQVEDGQGAVRA